MKTPPKPPLDQRKSVISEKRRLHPNSLANLKPFKPGQSGNPKGRPSEATLMGIVSQAMDRATPDGSKTVVEVVVRAILDRAIAGDGELLLAVAKRLPW